MSLKNGIKMEKKTIAIIAGYLVLIAISITGFSIQKCRLERYRSECNVYRERLEAAVNREQELKSTVEFCYESIERTDVVLGSATTTIKDLRSQLAEVRKVYEAMADRLYSCINSSTSELTN